jgi:single-strand DNA-binding protein
MILTGRLRKDPEVENTPSGAPVAKFSLATNQSFKDKSGEQQKRTEWHNIIAWNRLAEICGQYLTKEKQVYLEGQHSEPAVGNNQGGNKRTYLKPYLDGIRRSEEVAWLVTEKS